MRKPVGKALYLHGRPTSKKQSKSETLQQHVLTYVRHAGLSAESIRTLAGMGAKFIIKRSDWDFDGEIVCKPRLGLNVSGHPNVENVVGGFIEIRAAQMLKSDEFTDFLRTISRFDAALQRKRCKLKIRKKRIERYLTEISSAVNRAFPGEASGIRYALYAIKQQFLLR